jgi:hypothetical protein
MLREVRATQAGIELSCLAMNIIGGSTSTSTLTLKNLFLEANLRMSIDSDNRALV